MRTRCVDVLLDDSIKLSIGGLPTYTVHTPGNTLACMTYWVCTGHEYAAFVNDTLLMPGHGLARCDFPGGGRAYAIPIHTQNPETAGVHPAIHLSRLLAWRAPLHAKLGCNVTH